MKRTTGYLLAVALTAAGCITFPATRPEAPKAEAPKAAPPPSPPVVMPEQVTEASAAVMAKALKAELDYDAIHPPVCMPAPAEK